MVWIYIVPFIALKMLYGNHYSSTLVVVSYIVATAALGHTDS